MKSQKNAFRVACVLLYGAWQVACDGTTGGNIQPPPPNVTVAVSPASANLLVGQTQQFTATVSDGSSVTWSATPGAITSTGMYTAPSTVPNPATATVTATSVENPADSASAKVNIGQITGVTITPTSAILAENMTQKFSATVTGSGTFDNTVTWTASTGTVDSTGNYTPPQGLKGFATDTVTATSTENTQQSASATVTIGFGWIQYYVPEGLTGCSATATGVSLDQSKLVVAYYCDIPNFPQNTSDQWYTPNAAALLLFDAMTGDLLDSSWTDSPTPSAIWSMVAAPDGTIYAGGYEGNDSSREAWVLKITVGDTLQVEKFQEFQLDNLRTEVHVIREQGGIMYLATNSDAVYYCDSTWYSGGDWVVTLDASGNITNQFETGGCQNNGTTETGITDIITGLAVLSDHLWAVGNYYENDQLTSAYLMSYSLTGQMASDTVESPNYNNRVFENSSGEVLQGGSEPTSTNSSNQQVFSLVGMSYAPTPTGNPPYSTTVNLAATWDGDNPSVNNSVSVNYGLNSLFNPQGGLIVIGSCSQVGSSDPNQTDACAISWSGAVTPGRPTPIFWKQRFDAAHTPGGTASVWRDAVLDSQGNLYLVGQSPDGKVVAGKFTPPA